MCPRCGAAVESASADDSQASFLTTVAVSVNPSVAPTLSLAPSNGSPPAPPPSEAVAPPGYEVLDELGRGGMGVVYKARQLGLGRLVALKMILHGGHAGEEERQRFRAEAEAIARLQHPNVVQIYEVGEHTDLPFFSLEFCPGGSLADRLTGTPLPASQAAELIEALAGAVQAAHQAGVIHRDLKPANVLLTAEGAAKITDFGLAKKLDEQGRTATGSILGTPSYMAPEQAAGQTHEIGPFTDVYALGAILYECLTGRPPFKGPTLLDTLEQVRRQEPVPPRRLQPKVPRDLETICLKCLHKEPARRYASARELADDCARFLCGEPIQARPAGRIERGWRWCRREPALASLTGLSVLALLLLLGVGFWYSARLGAAQGDAAAASARALAAENEAEAANQLAGTREYFGLLSAVRERAARRPTGWTWANAADLARAATLPPAAEAVAELRTELADCLSSVDVRASGHVAKGFTAFQLVFDPHGRWLALGERKAQAWTTCSVLLADPVTGRTLHRLSYSPSLAFQFKQKVQDGCTALAFSPDGRWLVLGTRSGMVHRWDLRPAPPHPEQSWSAHDREIGYLAFGSDSKTLFSLAEDQKLRRWDVANGWRKTAEFALRTVRGELAVSSRGRWVACTDEDRIHVLTPETLTPARDPIPLPGARRLAANPNGRTLAVEAFGTIRLIDVASGQVLRTLRAPGSETSQDGEITSLVFSSDGVLLASSATWTSEVRLWDLAGGRLLAGWVVGSGTARASFQPDGRGLAVLAEEGAVLYEIGGRDMQSVSALHAGPVRAIAFRPGSAALVCLAETVLYQKLAWELSSQAHREGPTSRRWLERGSARGLAFAPDGRSLICPQKDQVYRWDLATGTGQTIDLSTTPDRLRFAPGGRLWIERKGEIAAWDLPATKPVAHWDNALADAVSGLGGVRDLAAGRRGVVLAGRDGTCRLLRPDDARQQGAWSCTRCPLTAVALNPAESVAAVGGEQGELVLLGVDSGEVMARTPAHTDALTSLAFAGERLLASGSRDQTVRLFDCDGRTARPLFTLRLPGPVQEVAFAADARRLAVLVHGERATRLWDLGRLWPHLDRLAPAHPLPTLPAAATAHGCILPPIEEPAPGPHGLRAELFDGPDFERKVVTRYDLPPSADWNAAPPDPRLPPTCYSIRWTGWLRAPKAGRYNLRLNADDGVCLWLDGKRIIHSWKLADKDQTHDATVDLTAGPHALRIDYFQAWGGAHISFHWSVPGGSWQPVPAEVLFHERTAAQK
jgi:WD40 repeat protein/predicted Ser/Thr protein kinase